MLESLIPYRLIIWVLLAVGVVGGFYFQYKEIQKLEGQVSTQQVNIKSYMQGMQSYYTKDSVLHSQVITQQQTLATLKEQKDPTQTAILDSLKRWHISASSVTQLEQTGNQLRNEKTIPLPTQQGKLIDSTYNLSDEPYIEEYLRITSDPTGYKLKRDLIVNDVETRVWHTHKETINPPSHIFFIRWFQKKQLIEQEDVTHSNPYMKTLKEQNTHVIK